MAAFSSAGGRSLACVFLPDLGGPSEGRSSKSAAPANDHQRYNFEPLQTSLVFHSLLGEREEEGEEVEYFIAVLTKGLLFTQCLIRDLPCVPDSRTLMDLCEGNIKAVAR